MGMFLVVRNRALCITEKQQISEQYCKHFTELFKIIDENTLCNEHVEKHIYIINLYNVLNSLPAFSHFDFQELYTAQKIIAG